MISSFIERFEARKETLRTCFREKHPQSYKDIVIEVMKLIAGDDEYECPDPARVHQIDDGSYQGTLVFVIAGGGYQPSDYWYVMVGYGSCSGCDTLERIRGYSDDPPTDEQVNDYMALALHIVQGIKKMGVEETSAA